MEKEKQLIPITICNKPKTVILVDKNLSDKEIKKRINSFLDKTGNLRIDTVKEYSIYGGH